MGTIAEKLAYLSDAVDDIQDAINEKGVTVDDTVVLGNYGNKIRAIQSGSGNTFMDLFGARTYSETTITPVSKTYTSL